MYRFIISRSSLPTNPNVETSFGLHELMHKLDILASDDESEGARAQSPSFYGRGSVDDVEGIAAYPRSSKDEVLARIKLPSRLVWRLINKEYQMKQSWRDYGRRCINWNELYKEGYVDISPITIATPMANMSLEDTPSSVGCSSYKSLPGSVGRSPTRSRLSNVGDMPGTSAEFVAADDVSGTELCQSTKLSNKRSASLQQLADETSKKICSQLARSDSPTSPVLERPSSQQYFDTKIMSNFLFRLSVTKSVNNPGSSGTQPVVLSGACPTSDAALSCKSGYSARRKEAARRLYESVKRTLSPTPYYKTPYELSHETEEDLPIDLRKTSEESHVSLDPAVECVPSVFETEAELTEEEDIEIFSQTPSPDPTLGGKEEIIQSCSLFVGETAAQDETDSSQQHETPSPTGDSVVIDTCNSINGCAASDTIVFVGWSRRHDLCNEPANKRDATLSLLKLQRS